MANKPFQIEGMDAALKMLDNLPAELKKGVELEMEASATEIVALARSAAPVDLGQLRAGISFFKIGELSFEITSNAHYSPYVEFGTGALVNVPAGLEEYAMQFKGKGIKQVNIPAHPFFFPAFEKEKLELIKRIKAIVEDLK
jgi:HK97 gp10 family phage protein